MPAALAGRAALLPAHERGQGTPAGAANGGDRQDKKSGVVTRAGACGDVFYARPHLPQGAPTSPAIANLCARRFDHRLAALALAVGATYTRYADDLAFSGDAAFARRAGSFSAAAAAILQEEGFSVQHRKTRCMHASVRQHLAGLTVNVNLTPPRKEWERLEAILTNCVRHGPGTQNLEAHPDLRLHLQGKVSFMAMVNSRRAGKLRALLDEVDWAQSRS